MSPPAVSLAWLPFPPIPPYYSLTTELPVHRGSESAPRHSAILQLGKADLPSEGIDDNLSESRYPGSTGLSRPLQLRNSDLPEMREPGRFTPRKQQGNPSGNAELVKRWGSGMDISMKALQGEWEEAGERRAAPNQNEQHAFA